MLEHGNFHIGMEFWTEAGRWRCTDVGARTICAIKLEGDPRDWDGNSAYAKAAGQGWACQRSRMGKSAHLRQKTLNKLSGSPYRGVCDAQNLGNNHAHAIGLQIRAYTPTRNLK